MKRKLCCALLPAVCAMALLLSHGLMQPARAAEAAGKAVWSLSGLAVPPVLVSDTTQNVVRKPVELSFTDSEAWRQAISGVSVDGAALEAGKYTVDAGKIIIDKSIFKVSKDYAVVIKAAGYADAAVTQSVGLICVTGDGVSGETVFTRAELAAMNQVRVVFSATNDFPYDLFVTVEGVPLRSLLEQAGMKPEARMIIFTATDGYRAEFTVDELLQTLRYKFPEQTEVEPVLALKRMERTSDFNQMNEQDTPVICFGQRARTEQTLLGFCKLIQFITVTSAAPEQWDKPAAKIVDPGTGQKTAVTDEQTAVKRGSQIYLENSSPKTKIYCTTGGAAPDLDSVISNAHGCGPLAGQDEPIVVNKDTVVKAKAVWFGKLDSDVATFTFTVGSGTAPDTAADQADGGSAAQQVETFADIENNWAREDIEYLAGKKLIYGKSETTFEPEGSITRAEFAALLVRALGLPEGILKEGRYQDMPDGAWYAGSTAAATAEKIITGYEGGFFMPEYRITREEMAVMLVRAARVAGKELTALSIEEQKEQLSRFPDRSMISPWAAQEVALAARAGIINGLPGGYFDPQACADRAQSAVMLKRFLAYVNGTAQ